MSRTPLITPTMKEMAALIGGELSNVVEEFSFSMAPRFTITPPRFTTRADGTRIVNPCITISSQRKFLSRLRIAHNSEEFEAISPKINEIILRMDALIAMHATPHCNSRAALEACTRRRLEYVHNGNTEVAGPTSYGVVISTTGYFPRETGWQITLHPMNGAPLAFVIDIPGGITGPGTPLPKSRQWLKTFDVSGWIYGLLSDMDIEWVEWESPDANQDHLYRRVSGVVMPEHSLPQVAGLLRHKMSRPLGSMVDYTPAQWEGFVRRAWRFILAIALRTPRDSAFPWLGPVREQIEAQWAEFLSWQLSDCPETESTSVTVNPAVDFALREAQTEGMLEFTASDPEHPENMHAHTMNPFSGEMEIHSSFVGWLHSLHQRAQLALHRRVCQSLRRVRVAI